MALSPKRALEPNSDERDALERIEDEIDETLSRSFCGGEIKFEMTVSNDACTDRILEIVRRRYDDNGWDADFSRRVDGVVIVTLKERGSR